MQPGPAIGLVCISVTHNTQPSVPSGDVLTRVIIQNDTAEELHTAVSWIASLPLPIKIGVGGNHDKAFHAKYRVRELLDSFEVN